MKLRAVALLLGLHFTPPVLAIGLGELSVHSHLEQPLHATVEVLSAPSTLDADCLSLSAGSNGLPAPVQARFRIERRGENALLHITTASPVSDPVAQFVLTSDCEGRLQREYALLLDPPPLTEPATVAETQPEQAAKAAATMPARTSTAPRRTARRSAAKSAAIRPTAAVLAPAPVVPPRRAAAPEPQAPAATPRLVISGKNASSGPGSLPAGPERNPASPNLTTAELSDENTALNHRLAHLESQLAELQKRNAELEARFAAAPAAAAKPAVPATHWPLNLLGLGLLASSGALVVWMRRQRDLTRGEAASAVFWTRPADAMPARVRIPREAASPKPDQDGVELPLSALAEKTDVKDDILDQAEVYVAHGHTNLAINALQDYLRGVPAESPVPWLLLLDLLLREGDEAGYAEASTECRRHFNVNFPTRPRAQEPENNRGLETYPHILQMLTQAWNTPQIHAIFKDLIHDQRHGARMGFEPGAYRDILLLRGIAQEKG